MWIPRFGKIETDDEFLKEYIDIISKLKTHNYFSLLETAMFGWVGYLNKNKEMIDYIKEKFKMIPLDSPEFEDFLATAIKEGELEKEKIIKEKQKQIEEKDKKLKEKQKQIEEKQKQIEEKDKIIEKLRKEIIFKLK